MTRSDGWRVEKIRVVEQGRRLGGDRFVFGEDPPPGLAAGRLPRSGEPFIVLHGGLKDWFDAQHLMAHITVTDESEYAASFCVVEKTARDFK